MPRVVGQIKNSQGDWPLPASWACRAHPPAGRNVENRNKSKTEFATFMKNRLTLTHGTRLTRWVFVGLAACAFGFSTHVLASNVTNISIGDFFFSPTAVTINVNDQVRWTWIGSAGHTTTSDTGLWDSSVKGNASRSKQSSHAWE